VEVAPHLTSPHLTSQNETYEVNAHHSAFVGQILRQPAVVYGTVSTFGILEGGVNGHCGSSRKLKRVRGGEGRGGEETGRERYKLSSSREYQIYFHTFQLSQIFRSVQGLIVLEYSYLCKEFDLFEKSA